MTAPNDPWATGANAAPETPQYTDGSALAGAYAPSGSSQLFSSGPVLPSSLFNKTHVLGTERTGIIKAEPYDVQSRDFNTKSPKFWTNTPVIGANGKPSKITSNAVDHVTGEKLRPVMDTVIELSTEYRFDVAESMAVGRDHTMPDDGTRAVYLSGDDLKSVISQIRTLKVQEGGMTGLRLTVKRSGQKPNPGGYPSWVNTVTLSRP